MSTGNGELPITQRLREETREWHERVEQSMDLMRPDLSLERYRYWIGRFLGFYRPLERAMFDEHSDWITALGLDSRRKTALLESDWFELTGDRKSLAELPECAGLSVVHSVPRLLGIFYVTEGATLGGQLICRRVRQLFPEEAVRGISFFASYGEQTGARWKEFKTLLESRSNPKTDGQIVEAACQTFAAFAEWFGTGNNIE